MKRKIRIRTEFQHVRYWRFFESFYLIPTLATFTLNTFQYGVSKYYYTRYVCLYWLWFNVSLSWEYGPIKHDKR